MSDPHPFPADCKTILGALVAFDTTSRNSNLPIVEWIEGYLDRLNVRHTRHAGWDRGKFNLHAMIGPDVDGGIAFSGHLDTVPVDGQDWTSDPFTLREENGLLYGRGTTDMKGYVACMLALVPDLVAQAEAGTLTHPVHLLFTCDEEITCDGARALIADLQKAGRVPPLCVVGEPTLLSPVIAHKGRFAVRVRLTGRAGHSSAPQYGRNALHAMGRAIAICADEADRLAAEGPRADGFDPPYTTMQVGLAEGGAILNIIPEQAWFDVEWRTVPDDDNRAAFDRLRDALAPLGAALAHENPGGGVTYEQLCDLPPLALPEDSPLADLARQVTGRNTAGYVSYGTEAGIYQRGGMDSIVCGPGDIAQAHRPDEFVAITQLARCEHMLRDFVKRSCHRR